MAIIGMTDSYGNILREARLSQNLTLQRLSRGLCSTATLSRIEAGERVPSILLVSGLFERLGISAGSFEMVLTDEEYERLEKRELIDSLIARNDVSADETIRDYESLIDGEDMLERQFLIHRKSLSMLFRLGPERLLMGTEMGGVKPCEQTLAVLAKIKACLENALMLTLEDEPPLAATGGMTVTERSLRIERDCMDYLLGMDDRERAGAFLKLREAFAGFESMKERDDGLSRPLYMSALACVSWYYRREEYPQALRICDRALELLDGRADARGRAFVYLAEAKSLGRLGSSDPRIMSRAEEFLKLSYHLLGFLGDAVTQRMVESAL